MVVRLEMPGSNAGQVRGLEIGGNSECDRE